MDAKALAKSKRAHSQHHSKKHRPTQAPKARAGEAVGATNATKPSGKQVRDKSVQSRGSATKLPSNWDRYEEEDDMGAEVSMTGVTDVIAPKSKGADYGYLISEAKSQSQTTTSSDTYPSLDDIFADFNQGIGSLLSVRGEGIVSWTEDDNFTMEDCGIASPEASFLSLNLHALADQLAKVDPSKRLFIEADLLPPELCTELKASSTQEFDQSQAEFESEAAQKDSGELNSHGFLRDKNMDQYCEVLLHGTTSNSVPTQANKVAESVNSDLQQFDETGQSLSVDSTAEIIVNLNKQQSRFEAAAAEAELDMLLNSFSETDMLDSSGLSDNSFHTSYVSRQETSTSPSTDFPSIHLACDQHLKEGASDISKSSLLTASLDDAIDNLLDETSSLMIQNGTAQASRVISASIDIQSSSSSAISKSNVLDDFDSWLDTIN